MRQNISRLAAALSVALGIHALPVSGAVLYTYNGNGHDDGGGAVGQGTLTLGQEYDDYVTLGFTPAAGTTWNKYLVIYIDSVPGGISSTDSLKNNGISGLSEVAAVGRAGHTANFAPGFQADYVITLPNPNDSPTAYLFQIQTPGSYSDLDCKEQISFLMTAGTAGFFFKFSDLGLNSGDSFKVQTTYVDPFGGYRTMESFENVTGSGGQITFQNYEWFGAPPVPEPVNVALGIFGVAACGFGVVRRFRK